MTPQTSRPRRPVLAPGLRIAHPAAGELEIGLTREHRLRVPDTPAVRRVLDALDRGEAPPDSPATRRALDSLAPALRDGSSLVQPRLAPEEVAAAVLRHPSGASERLRRRARHRVLVVGPEPAIDLLDPGSLLSRSGLQVSASPRERHDVALVVAHGEPPRTDLDPLLRHGTPHLLLRLVESEVVLGPFVVPGRTACLRCLDAHDAVTDPAHFRAVSGYVGTERHDGVPEPVDAAVATTALGWAAADLVRFAEGDRPSTWSATIAFASGRAGVQAVDRLRHPTCPCWWGAGSADPDADDGSSVTMDA